MTETLPTPPILTPLAPGSFRSKPWKNGGGITVDIADACAEGADPAGWEGMIWRLGRTAIVQPGPFSDLTGYERLQAVIVGSGLVLDGAEGAIDLRVAFRPVRYDGGLPLVSRLENGPVEVVNLIVERALCSADLVVPRAGEAMSLTGGIHILYAPGEAVRARCGEADVAVPGGHALRIDAATDVALRIEAGQVLLATIRLR
ncbi:HutD family protein [Bosea sp. (in: a-proteobacteria)]|uniref:HutD/Ves family protein n=1 Tax=Bosea sp. (in: a-proteobacteria) TaxID=1871050 RepID=UPI0027325F80|nr:HutD family protein [Bosea sp. (in: a-proteobacteria)]MDP3408699.1 HutD family protein [Bosea sp. (in: a-proteobacteria)]